MKLRLAVVIALFSTAALADEIEFAGFLINSGKPRFVLRSGVRLSGWLELGQNFDGIRVIGFDPTLQVLTIEEDGKKKVLQLVQGRNQSSALLNPQILTDVLKEILPPERFDPSQPYGSLLEDLRHFGILTAGDVKAMVLEKMEFVESEEKKQYDLMKQIGEQYKTRPPTIVRGYHYNHVGMARIALRGYVGEDVFSAYEVEKSRESEKDKRPNQSPEPTPTSVTPRAP